MRKTPLYQLILIIVLLPTLSIAQWNSTIQSPIYFQPTTTIPNSTLNSNFNLYPSSGTASSFSIMSNNWDISGGYGLIDGDNVVSPVVWMYSGGSNAFTVAKKNYTGGQGQAVMGDYLIPLMQVRTDGNVGIGTVHPDFKLTVNGKIKAEEIQVVVDVPADYVFSKEYKLMPLSEVAKYIKKNNHLPNVPSAQELKEQGWQVGEMNNKLLEKIEELTLYLIDLEKKSAQQEERIQALEKQIQK